MEGAPARVREVQLELNFNNKPISELTSEEKMNLAAEILEIERRGGELTKYQKEYKKWIDSFGGDDNQPNYRN